MTHGPVVLLVGQEQAPVEADLGVFIPGGGPQWGGLLRGVPVRLAAAMRRGEMPSSACPADSSEGFM